jgi:hypothetical protein
MLLLVGWHFPVPTCRTLFDSRISRTQMMPKHLFRLLPNTTYDHNVLSLHCPSDSAQLLYEVARTHNSRNINSISLIKIYFPNLDTFTMPQVSILHDEQEELVQRYDKERDKRLTKAGLSQYIDVRSKEIQDLARDPWVDYSASRIQNPPLKDGGSIKFLISGAGHNGLLFGCRLVEAGFSGRDIVCVDIAGGFGGTWYVFFPCVCN